MRFRHCFVAAVTVLVAVACSASDDDATHTDCVSGVSKCVCRVTGESGQGSECLEGFLPETTCCAEDWPSERGRCECADFRVLCFRNSISCTCLRGATVVGADTPSCAAPPGGHCCAKKSEAGKVSEAKCTCSSAACDATEDEVTSCAPGPPECTFGTRVKNCKTDKAPAVSR